MYYNKFQYSGKLLFQISLCILLMGTSAFADYATNLVFSGYVQDASGDIDAGSFSVPVVYDWNSDGKKDLLIGHKFTDVSGAHGYVSFYENAGTNSSPLFYSPTYIEACNTVCNYLDAAAFG